MKDNLCQVTSKVIRMLGNNLIINCDSITHMPPIRIDFSQEQINLHLTTNPKHEKKQNLKGKENNSEEGTHF